MNGSIIRQLVLKDLSIMKLPALLYLLGGLAAVAFTLRMAGSGWVFWLFGQVLFVAVLFGAGVHAAMRTIVEERREQNLAFVMSLPVTILDYTKAKIIANVALSGTIWLALTAASCVVFIRGILPLGAVPFIIVFFVAVLLAYVLILSATIVFTSHAAAITAVMGTNLLGTLAFWWFVDLEGVRSTVTGESIVWNRTYLSAFGIEGAAIAGLIVATLFIQSRKTDFVG